MRKTLIATFILICAFAITAQAQRGRGPGRGPMGPPPEAVDACADLEEGDDCSFENRRGDTVEGTCELPPRGDELSCRPDNMPGPPPGPPPEPPESEEEE